MRQQVETLRRANQAVINQDPIEVSVQRRQWADNGAGGRQAVDSTLGPYTARVYYRRPEDRLDVNEAGGRYRDEIGVLLPHDADVRAGDDVEDVIVTADGRRLRVRAVMVRTWAGERWAVQAVCQEVR